MEAILYQLLGGLIGILIGAAGLLIHWRIVDGNWFLLEEWKQKRAHKK